MVLMAGLYPPRAWVAELDSEASRVVCDLCVGSCLCSWLGEHWTPPLLVLTQILAWFKAKVGFYQSKIKFLVLVFMLVWDIRSSGNKTC